MWEAPLKIYGLKIRSFQRIDASRKYEASPFTVGVSDTAKILAKELKKLRARNLNLVLSFGEQVPKADAKLLYPGVVVYFDCRYGRLSFFHCKFRDWQDNLRAIALHLEHLRKASQYGVGEDGQQYLGWKEENTKREWQEESSKDRFDEDYKRRKAEHEKKKKPFASIAEAKMFIYTMSGLGVDACKAKSDQEIYRKAAARLHPDSGGNHESFVRLQQAKDYLKSAGAWV